MTEQLLYSHGIEAYVGEDADGKYFRKVLGNDFAFKDADQIATEIAALQNLSHPRIPRIISGSSNGTVELKRTYMEGQSLRQLLDERRTFGREDVVNMALQVLDVLHYAHDKGILHQDVKPSNLIYDQESDVLAVVDWGIAKLRYYSGTTASTAKGSFSTMAPEQLKGKSFPSSDIYSLGATLVELLTGKPLDEYVNGESIFEQRVQLPETIDLGLRNVLERMLETDCRRRYQTCTDVIKAFTALKEQPVAYGMKEKGNGRSGAAPRRSTLVSPSTLDNDIEEEVDNENLIQRAIKLFEDKSRGFTRQRELESVTPKIQDALDYDLVKRRKRGSLLDKRRSSRWIERISLPW